MQRKKRLGTIIAFVFILILGIFIGAFGAVLYSGQLIANTISVLTFLELSRSEDAAMDASKLDSPETAIWALERHLDLIAELREVDFPEEGILDLQEVTAHVRLMRLYDSLGKVDEKRKHISKAVEIAKTSKLFKLMPIDSEEDLNVFLNGLDNPSQRDETYWQRKMQKDI